MRPVTEKVTVPEAVDNVTESPIDTPRSRAERRPRAISSGPPGKRPATVWGTRWPRSGSIPTTATAELPERARPAV